MHIIILFLILYCTVARAATINAASTSSAHVQAAIDSAASSGDTVVVPAGSSTWTTSVTITGKALTIQGNGVGSTIITDQGSSGGALLVTCTATNIVRVTGFEFRSSTAHSNGIVQFSGNVSGGIDGVGFRFDNSKVSWPSTVSRGIVIEGIFGLIDHNTFLCSTAGSVQGIAFYGSNDGSNVGFTPWTRALTLGTNKAVYIEDNTFDFAASDQTEDCIDAYGGARIVIRHNTFTGTTCGFHGTDSGDRRSPHSFEVYSNAFTNNSATKLRALTVRGGTGVVYSNTYGGSKAWDDVTLMYYRATTGLDNSQWQRMNGTNWKLNSATLSDPGSRECNASGTVAFDTATNELLGTFGAGTFDNYFDGSGSTTFAGTTVNGYPGRDQPGYTTGQVLSPIYIWSNGKDGSTYGGGTSPSDEQTAAVIQLNREWYNNGSTPKPGYTAYTYPYPWAGSGTGGNAVTGKATFSGKVSF